MSAETFSSGLLVSPGTPRVPLARMLPVSLALHLVVLLVLSSLQLSSPRERAVTTYHVSLVTLPSPTREARPPVSQPAELDRARPAVTPPTPSPAKPEPTVEAAKVPQPPVTVPEVKPRTPRPPEAKPVSPTAPPKLPVPAPVQEAAPKMRPTAPKVAPVMTGQPAGEISEGPKPAENLMREVLREIELPPQAPTLGHLKPVPPTMGIRRPRTAKKEIDALLGRLAVPPESVPPVKATPPIWSEDRARPSLSEEISKQLQNVQPPASVPTATSTPAPSANPPAKPAALSKPEAKIQVAGNPGSNKYLALVQSQISRQWVAPQVDLTGRSLWVVVGFRLHRSGAVSNVSVERPSGNGYYDDAGLRAVLAATPLPPFPPEMADAYLDAHFTFTVGEQIG